MKGEKLLIGKPELVTQLVTHLRPGFEVDARRKRDTPKTLLDFDQPVRDQEVDGSNPFAPTISSSF
jgi:hypothetical protein